MEQITAKDTTFRYKVKHSAITFGRILPWFILIGIMWFLINKPTQQIIAKKGSKITVMQQSKRLFIPFVEGGVEQQRNSELAPYLRVGLRIEF